MMLLLKLYTHFNAGMGYDFNILASTMDFSGTNQQELGIPENPVIGEAYSINLFNSGINANSLAFGRLIVYYQGDNMFKIKPNKFDFSYEKEGTWKRNVGTFFGSAVFGDIFSAPAGGQSWLRNKFGLGGPFQVNFIGNVYIPPIKK